MEEQRRVQTRTNGTTIQYNSRREPAAFQGDLSVITIENLMQLVSHAALSGELQLVTPVNSAIFFVHQGSLVYGYLEENPLRIGKRLEQGNYIANTDLQKCISQYQGQSPQPKIGSILVEKDYLQQADLEKVIKEQIKDIFFEVLSWKEGSFSFLIKEIPDNDGIFLEDRLDGARRLASAAIDALVGIDHEEVRPFVEAIHWAYFDAVRQFAFDTGFCDNECHGVTLCWRPRKLCEVGPLIKP